MFVTVLLAAGMLALERTENAYARLVRGLVTPGRLLAEKIVLSGGCAALVTLLMAAFVSLFVHLDWSRFELWVAALALGGLAFGALGVAIGAAAREVSAASLLAFLVSLPIAFVALVPANAVSRNAEDRARRDRVRVPVQGGPAGGHQRVHRRDRRGSACRCCTWRYWPWCSALLARLGLRRFATR